MTARITFNVLGWKIATINFDLDLDLFDHDGDDSAAPKGKLVKKISQLWMRGMVA